MTQLEMTTSTLASGSGMCSISPLRNVTLWTPRLAGCLGEREHLVGHIQAVREAGRANASG